MRTLGLSMVALVGLTLGCSADNYLSGQWFERVTLDAGGQPLPPTNGTGLWVELNLGHYGEDVVGVIRFYKSSNRTKNDRIDCNDPEYVCSCDFVEGRYDSDSEIMAFDFLSCVEPRVRLCATLKRHSDTETEWAMRPCDQPTADGDVATFEQTKPGDQLIFTDKACTKCE